MAFRIWNRKLHRWAALLSAAPFLLVLATGILLQVKKEVPWVQPATMTSPTREPGLPWPDLLTIARSVPEAQIQTWADIDRIDLQPRKGVLKVIAKSRWEIQLDAGSGAVLQVAYRRSDLIESLHDGSWFSDAAKLGVFLPSALLVLLLALTGLYLWWLPNWVRWRRPATSSTLKAPQSVAAPFPSEVP